MSIKNIVVIVLVIYIFIFPDKAKADELIVYYLNSDNVYDNMLKQTFETENNCNTAQKVFIILDKLFNDISGVNYIPKNTNVLSVEKLGENVYINISEEILSYGGGSVYEIGIIRQLLFNIFQFNEIKCVSIFIENQKKYFPEGSLIYNYRKEDFDNHILLKG